MTQFSYVGPTEFLDLVGPLSDRQQVHRAADVLTWLERTQQVLDADNQIVTTFIIDTQSNLWIADRRSEHVVCANGGPVLSAGEMTFRVSGEQVEVVEVTNQSTGFCPRPESWPSVASALDEIGLLRPADFAVRFDFRRCDQCAAINIVKENWFVCAVCDAELDREWNF